MGFASEATAKVAASMDLVAAIVHQVDAVGGATNFFKSWKHGWRGQGEFAHAISALFHFLKFFVLLASLAIVVRLCATLRICAENFPAILHWATNSIFGHAFCCISGNGLVIIVSCIHINFSLYNFHSITAAA